MILPSNPKNIFSADMLRSGSTHIQMSLSRSLGWRPISVVRINGEGQGEQNINPMTFAVLVPYGYQVIGGHHVAYSELVQYLESFHLKPIVTVRNLYDTIVSIRERILSTWPSRMMPGLYIPSQFHAWDDEDQYMWLAHQAGAWQTKFVYSWIEYSGEKLFVQYEEFYKNQLAGIKRILDFYGIDHPPDEKITSACSEKNNFNVGTSGRGWSMLPTGARAVLDDHLYSWGCSAEMEKILYA